MFVIEKAKIAKNILGKKTTTATILAVGTPIVTLKFLQAEKQKYVYTTNLTSYLYN